MKNTPNSAQSSKSLTLSHGQADVERGISLNNAVPQSNMKHDSVVSKRLIQDHLVSNNLKPHTIEINSQLRSSCRLARQLYSTHLEEEKRQLNNNQVIKLGGLYQWKSKNYEEKYQH